jgi:adenine-specific DNA-methyltransferase
MSDEKIQELEQEIKQLKAKLKKRYGLIWEEKPEQFDKDSENALPILKDKNNPKYPNINTGVKNGKAPHILIEGDNYHTLSVLNYTHKGKIDVIYIDPPYNTGNNDFIYNDKFVDKEDSFRHSKWLSFMSKRLKLAKDLLTDDGVIFISIDDNEQAQLKLLCDEVFGERNFVGFIPRLTSAQRPSQEGYFGVNHDYIVVYTKIKNYNFKATIKRKEVEVLEDHIGYYIKGDTSPILASSTQGYSKGGDYDIEFNNKIYSPIDSNNNRRRWLWTKKRMLEAIKLGILVETPTSLRVRNYINKEFSVKTNTMIDKSSKLKLTSFDLMDKNFVNNKGTKTLSNLKLNKLFDFSKPVELVVGLLELSVKKNSTILDFFAGSGTTGHAVLELNKQDGGNRQFILATNNENGICENITYERIKRVMQGYTTPKGKEVEGLGGELQYLKTDFIKKDNNLDDLRLSIVNASTTILCCKESIFNIVIDNYQHNKFKIFKDDNKYLCILFGEFAPNLQAFYDEFKKFNHNKVIIYAFVSDVEHLSTELKNIDSDIDFHIKEIPDELLATYNEIFGL